MASTEKTIWEAVAAVLVAAELAVGGRAVTVRRQLPDQAFKQRELPVVFLERPRQAGTERINSTENRDEYRLRVYLVDECKPTPDGMDEADERLGLMRKLVEEALWDEPTLGLIALGVMQPFWEFRQVGEEPTDVGNGLLSLECELVIPVVLRRPV